MLNIDFKDDPEVKKISKYLQQGGKKSNHVYNASLIFGYKYISWKHPSMYYSAYDQWRRPTIDNFALRTVMVRLQLAPDYLKLSRYSQYEIEGLLQSYEIQHPWKSLSQDLKQKIKFKKNYSNWIRVCNN